MKSLALIPLLYCLLGSGNREKEAFTISLDDPIKGSWTNERTQIQYIVDSHLVHEEEIANEKGKIYEFNGTIIRVKYPGGTTAQGTYSIFEEDGRKKVALHLLGTTTVYSLIAVTPTSMSWQKDLEDVYYYEGFVRHSAERAIYTETFKK